MNRLRTVLLLGVLLALSTSRGNETAAQTTTPPPRLGLKVDELRYPDGSSGVVVKAIVPESPASRALSKTTGRPQTIRPGDRVVGFAGEFVEADGTFARRVAAASGRVELVVRSQTDGRERRVLVDLPPAERGESIRLSIGLTVRSCDGGIHVEAVEPGSAAAESVEGKTSAPAVIAPGSHLLSINGLPVRTPTEAADGLASAGGEIHFEIEQPKSPGAEAPPINLYVIGRVR